MLMGKKQGQIASARSLLYSMRKAGMYLSNKVLNKALALVNE
ncbi:MAG: DUF3368 domain-containing protein [Gammaproteobacteria bacterium]|nr:DUF3368 domain-containing protein [Gammaproteobacteria bacterium]